MDNETKIFIDSLRREDIPWDRMLTAYGTAKCYNEQLSVLETTDYPEEWKRALNKTAL